MSDRKTMKKQIKSNVRHLRDILTGIEMMSELDNDNNIGVAYTFTQKLIDEIHNGELSPKAIERFLNEGAAE
jgi:hypothetical protein